MPDRKEVDVLLLQDPFNQVTAEARNLKLGERLHLTNGKTIQARTIRHGPGQRKVFYVTDGSESARGGQALTPRNTHSSASAAAQAALARPKKVVA